MPLCHLLASYSAAGIDWFYDASVTPDRYLTGTGLREVNFEVGLYRDKGLFCIGKDRKVGRLPIFREIRSAELMQFPIFPGKDGPDCPYWQQQLCESSPAS